MFNTVANATPDLRSRVLAPAGTAGRHYLSNVESAVSAGSVFGTETGSVAQTTGANDILYIHGLAVVTASGSMSIELRNNVGNTVQTFAEGSILVAERIA